MTVNETFMLLIALGAGDRLRYRDAYEAVQGERAHYLLAALERQGAVEHLRYDHWRITEKGRIAAGLALHKDPKLAAAFGGTMIKLKAPWTDAQVSALTELQADPRFHGYTCPHDHSDQPRLLTATNDGWICPSCDYTQDWCHDALPPGLVQT